METEAKIKTVSRRIERLDEQAQEFEFQTTKFDVLLKKIDDLEAKFNMEKEDKDQECLTIHSKISILDTHINTNKQLQESQDEVLKVFLHYYH